MSDPLKFDDALTQLDRVVGLGDPQRVGWFRFFLDSQRWEWSDTVARMHGYEPGSVTPDTDLLIRHKYPDDRERIRDGIEAVLRGNPSAADTGSSTRHRRSRARVVDATMD